MLNGTCRPDEIVLLVSQTVMHGRHARRVLIAQVRNLNGGRLAGEGKQSVVGDVSGEIHQDVDAVVAYQIGNSFVRFAAHVAQMIRRDRGAGP